MSNINQDVNKDKFKPETDEREKNQQNLGHGKDSPSKRGSPEKDPNIEKEQGQSPLEKEKKM